jgi:hypothetical protein
MLELRYGHGGNAIDGIDGMNSSQVPQESCAQPVGVTFTPLFDTSVMCNLVFLGDALVVSGWTGFHMIHS